MEIHDGYHDPMNEKVWTVAEAKARLSEILRQAREKGPQRIGTKKPYVVLTEEEWLKLKEPLIVGRATAEYADNADAWNQNYSATLGNKFESPFGDIGAIFTISHIEKTIREDVLRVSPATREGRGDPQNQANFDNIEGFPGFPYFYPGFSDTAYGIEDRENTTTSGSLVSNDACDRISSISCSRCISSH